MGLGIQDPIYRWPNRTVPYALDDDVVCKAAVQEAIAQWNAATCVRFVPRTDETDYVRIQRMIGVAVSDVGRRGGEQRIGLGDTIPAGKIIHELGHAVGLWHEHCRNDRDDWVTVNWKNIVAAAEDQYRTGEICGEIIALQDFGDYDYGSIMHYGASDFVRSRRLPNLTPCQPLPDGVVIGQRVALSAGDIAAVAEMYANPPAAEPVLALPAAT